MVLKSKLFFQLMRFGVVGLVAAAVHFSTLILLVETLGLAPLKANFFAFLLAFQVSYWGHRRWTFQGTTVRHRIALPKLFFLGGAGFIANEAVFSFFLITFKLPYPFALFFTLTILPIINFTLSKLWVFR